MTTPAERLPDEVLFMIFDDFDYDEASEVQYVCPAWYRAAHAVSLRDIGLFGPDHVEQFIQANDSNPHPSYLQAVNNITIFNTDYPDRVFTEQEIRKVFFRFPNLESVMETFQEFLKCCPKLKDFRLNHTHPKTVQPEVYEALYPVRSLLTSLKIDNQIKNTRFKEDVWEYIKGFRNLKSLNVRAEDFNNFWAVLAIVEHLHKLEDVTMWDVKDDRRNFADYYLSAIESEKEEQRFIQQLSQFKKLTWRREVGVCIESIKFIEKYLTGLKKLDMYSQFEEQWEDMPQRIFCQLLAEIICRVDESHVFLEMDYESLTDYLPFMLHKLFYNPATAGGNKANTRILQLRLTDAGFQDTEDWSKLQVATWRSSNKVSRRVTVLRDTDVFIEDLIETLLSEDTPIENIDVFKLTIDKRRESTIEADTFTYCKLLQGMDAVQKVEVDIPASFKEASPEHDLDWYLRLQWATHLYINACSRAKFETLLHQYSLVFYNLDYLYFKYFCGKWKRSMGEFKLMLPEFSIKGLSLDITPVVVKMKKYLNKQKISANDYFVIHIDMLSNSKNLMFKVLLNSLKTTKITSKDLEGLKRGQDYIRIHVTISDLTDWLHLRKNTSNKPDEGEEYFDNQNIGLSKTIKLN